MKRNFKKIASCLLVIAMASSMVACGETASSTETATEIVASTNAETTTRTEEPTESRSGFSTTANASFSSSTEKVTEPVTELVTEPVTEKATEKKAERKTERQTEKATEKQTEKATEPDTTAPMPDPTEEPTEEPTVGPPIEEPTEEQVDIPSGKYSYSLYGGVSVNMDVNVDSYIKSDNGRVFLLEDLGNSLGWTTLYDVDEFDDEALPVPLAECRYTSGDMSISLTWGAKYTGVPAYNEEAGIGDVEVKQISRITLRYYKRGGGHYYDYSTNDSAVIREVSFSIPEKFSSAKYLIAPSSPAATMSYDEAVLISYLMWSQTKNPGKNPAYMSGNYDAFYSVCRGSSSDGTDDFKTK